MDQEAGLTIFIFFAAKMFSSGWKISLNNISKLSNKSNDSTFFIIIASQSPEDEDKLTAGEMLRVLERFNGRGAGGRRNVEDGQTSREIKWGFW